MSQDQKGHDEPPGLWGAGADASAGPGARRSRPQGRSRRQGSTSPVERDVVWGIDDVSSYLGVPKQTIYSWRGIGHGPQGFRVGKHLRWRASTVRAWLTRLEREE